MSLSPNLEPPQGNFLSGKKEREDTHKKALMQQEQCKKGIVSFSIQFWFKIIEVEWNKIEIEI